MKILVTGGAGYIGSHTCNLLHKLNHQVLAFDNLSTGFQESLNSEVFFSKGNILNKSEIDTAFKQYKPDVVIHFAAKLNVNESLSKPLEYYENNVQGLINILQIMKKYDTKKIVFSSTAAVYGDQIQNRSIKEDDLKKPLNPYGHSKLFCEEIIQGEAIASGLKYIILRYFNVAGASDDGLNGQRTPNAYHLVHVATKVATGEKDELTIFGEDYPTPDGTCVRDYIHVEDLAEIHKLVAEGLVNGADSEIFNCGYGHGYSVKEVITALKKSINADFKVSISDRRAGDPASLVADSSLLKDKLGWIPKRDDLELIVKSAYEWERKINSARRCLA